MPECRICGSSDIRKVWDLPGLPLTGIYVDSPDNIPSSYFHDQALLVCDECSHAQLGAIVDPDFLYLETYSHRTSLSAVSTTGNTFLLDFLNSFFDGRKFRQIVEIGCNDLYLMKNLTIEATAKAGVDPIFSPGEVIDIEGVKVTGGFAEETDYSRLMSDAADLVISAHTFEHVPEPREVLRTLDPHLVSGAFFVIEVPSSTTMLRNGRLDQVFAQHVNIFSPESLVALFLQFEFSLVHQIHNYSYWGGTQILVFQKGGSSLVEVQSGARAADYAEAVELFDAEVRSLQKKIDHPHLKNVCLGAAQMLPIIHYHLGQEAWSFSAILDENPSRVGKFFPGITTPIEPMDGFPDLRGFQVMISAIDSAKALVPKAIHRGSPSVLLPFGTL